MIKTLRLRRLEIWLSDVPRKTPGIYIQRRHYARHIITTNFYLAGFKLAITIMEK